MDTFKPEGPSSAAGLAEVAMDLFGDEWAHPLARLTQINVRTCQRVKSAAEHGIEDKKAVSVMAALFDQLSDIVRSMSTDPSLSEDGSDENLYLPPIRRLVRTVFEEPRLAYGPFSHDAMDILARTNERPILVA